MRELLDLKRQTHSEIRPMCDPCGLLFTMLRFQAEDGAVMNKTRKSEDVSAGQMMNLLHVFDGYCK